jgi:peptide/nickel transport system substrate-binding protein
MESCGPVGSWGFGQLPVGSTVMNSLYQVGGELVRRSLLVLTVLLIGVGLCAVAEVPYPETLRIGAISEAVTLDPVNAYDTASGQQLLQIYEGLVHYKKSSITEYEPWLATVVPSYDNGLVVDAQDEDGSYVLVTFPIRQGVKFHNGNSLDPEDVEYTFERGLIVDPDGGPQWMAYNVFFGLNFNSLADVVDAFGQEGALRKIQDAVVVSANNVTFKLYGPFGLFYASLMNDRTYWGYIVDKDYSVANGCWDGGYDIELGVDWKMGPEGAASPVYDAPNGTGPYMLEEWIPVQEVRLVKFDDYWRGWEGDHVDYIITFNISEWSTRRAMFEAGDLDVCNVPRQYLEQMVGLPGLRTVYGFATAGNSGIMMLSLINPESPFIHSGKLDGRGIPPDFFSDIDVRKAFCYSFDAASYAEQIYLGEAIASYSQLPIIFGDAVYQVYVYGLDLEKAEEHFRAAYGGQLWDIGFKLTLEYNIGNDMRRASLEILEATIESLNPKFDLDVVGLEWASHLPAFQSNQIGVYRSGWGADYIHPYNFIQPYYHSQGNFMSAQGFGTPEIDAKIAEMGAASDPAEMIRLSHEIQKWALDGAYTIPMVDPTGRYWERTWVNGVTFHSMGASSNTFYGYDVWKAEGGPGFLVDLILFPDMLVEEW